MVTPEFEAAYKRLNPEQKKAVDTIDGPVMVIAGPGTGKTEVLTLRIANILLQTDTKPEQILALTFTEAASSNMRKRLANVIGAPAYRVKIQTFHSFCNDILQSYPEFFPRVVGSSPVTEVESTAIIESIIKNEDPSMNRASFSVLKPWGEPLLYVGDILRKIEELKREGISPEKFKEILKKAEKDFEKRDDLYHEKGAYKGKMKGEALDYARKIEKNKELSLVYELYQEKLFEKRLYDWSDMIMEVLQVLEMSEKKSEKKLPLKNSSDSLSGSDPEFSRDNFFSDSDLKLILQENHQYILVDEHQDTNNAQNRILELLSDFHENPNIFVVGDHKQAIFRFQGASVENFLYFKKLYPKAVLIDLFRNYRSTQNILDSAHSVIPSDTELKSESLPLAKRELANPEGVNVAAFKNSLLERHWIAKKIKELEGEIAVIYRSNREAFPLAATLSKSGISYSIESDEDLLGDKFVKKFIVILEAVHNYGDDIYLAPLLHIEEMGVSPLEAYKIIRSAKDKKKPIYEILMSRTVLDSFVHKLEKWVKDSQEKNLPEFLECVFRESGILESMLKSRDADAFLGIEKLFEEEQRMGARKSVSLADFIEYLNTLRTHNLFIKKPKRESKPGAVRLMTAHRAKGLEFDYVFIVNASEKSFGGKTNRDRLPLIPLGLPHVGHQSSIPDVRHGEGQLEDERRLFYVALTRAKKQIFITYYENDESGKEILPSVFISEIKPELKTEIDTKEFEREIEKDKSVLFTGGDLSVGRQVDKEFVTELFYKEQFSVTALNNYLECPWRYFYRNLLRIPEIQAKYLLYGTAMHAAVETFLKTRLIKKDVDKEFLIDAFDKSIKDAPVSESEIKEMLKKGRESLSVWFEERQNSWILPYKMEQPLYGIEFDTGEGKVRLSGKIDKIEFVEEGGSEVFVTDYKTGKPKSRNEIEGPASAKATAGRVKPGSGAYKRQLVFYKLLLDLYDGGRYNMTKGTIEFLEPSESGRIKFEEFLIEKEEVEELKETIRRVENEIISLSFWNSYCDDKDCEYCAYRKLLDK